MDQSVVRQNEKRMARWGGLSSLQDQWGSECLRLNPAPPPHRAFHSATSLPDPAAKWTSLWAYAWGHGIRRLPIRSPLRPLGLQLPLPACPVPLLLVPAPAPVPAVPLPPVPALLVPHIPALLAQASLAHPAPALALLALPVLPQLVPIATASPAQVHL